MAYPVLYDITYSYTGFQQSQGDNSFPGTQLDADLAGLEASLVGLATFVEGVMRSDGALKNGVVTYDSLSANLQAAGLAPAGPWDTDADYIVGSSVTHNGSLYRALIAHTSGVFATDLAAGKWLLVTPVQGPQGVQGVQGAPGTNGTNGTGGLTPGGRLTLTSGTPVMATSVAGANQVFYTPALHWQVPLWDGANWNPTTFAEVSQLTTDTTKSPAAVAPNSLYDLFAWNDAGTFRVTRGPAWTSATARSAGTALSLQNGVNLNAVAITNGPAAMRGTYVGTIASNSGGTIDYIFGGVGAGGLAGVFNVWNAFNRAPVSCQVVDNTASWSYAFGGTPIWRAANSSNTARVTMVRGLNVDPVWATYTTTCNTSLAGSNAYCGVGLDATNAHSGTQNFFGGDTVARSGSAIFTGLVGLGQHFLQAVEQMDSSGTATFFGQSGGFSALSVSLAA